MSRHYAETLFADLGQFKLVNSTEYTCHCPFTDKANKFQFSTVKPTWYSWTLGEGGGWMEYLQRRHGWDWRQALQHLADAAGIKLGKLDEAAEQARDTRTAIFDAALRHFRSELFNARGKAVLDYLTGRGYSVEELRELEIGAFSDVNRLKRVLHEAGFRGADVEASGVAPPKSRGFGTVYQVIFPWTDYAGRTTGLVGRSILSQEELDKRDAPKYKYSTGLEKKSGLFGLDRARGKQAIVLVEGGLDALFLNHHGVATVATGGLGLNEQQVDALERARCKELLICWDNDSKGQTSTAKLLERIYPRPLKLYVVRLPAGFKDPDELVRAQGVDVFKMCLKAASTAARWHGGYLAGCFNLDHDRGRDHAVDAVHDIAQKIHNVDHQRELVRGFEEISGIEVPSLTKFQGAGGLREQEEGEKVQGSREEGNKDSGSFYDEADPAATTTESGKQRRFQATPREKHDMGLTDLANAADFATDNLHDLRHCPGFSKNGNPRTGWMHWDGRRWELDETGLIVERAKGFVHRLWRKPDQYKDRKREVALGWAAQCQSVKAINALLNLVPSTPQLIMRQSELDQHPLKLNLLNGVYDLEINELIKHDPELKLTRLLDFEYDADAQCPNWIKFMLWAMIDPEMNEAEGIAEAVEMVRYMARWWGYCLTGKTHIQAWLFNYGDSDNGKSVHNLVLNGLLGKVDEGGYLANSSPELLLSQRNGASEHERRLARLEPCRVVIGAEINEGAVLDEAQLKRLTGGEPVQARRLYNDEFSYMPQFKLIFSANFLPRVKSGGSATWRRLHPVRWPNRIRPEDKNLNLATDLMKELPGILNWAITGWRDLCARLEAHTDPLAPPPPVVRAASAYKEQSDIVGLFATACLSETHSDTVCNCHSVYEAFVTFAGIEGVSKHAIMGHTKFNRTLGEKGWVKDKYAGAAVWKGLVLDPPNTGGSGHEKG